ncbi:C-terminal processing protease CtpA/Prc [Pedobacter sp. UYEF25]
MNKIVIFLMLLFLANQVNAQTVKREKQVANIASFARLYGYVRYFHPSNEAAEIDWDKFVAYGIKQVENAQTDKVLGEKLNQLFNPIAPSVLVSAENDEKIFNKQNITPPKAGAYKEITWQHLGMGVQAAGPYKSIRTNRSIKVIDPSKRNFGVATNSINIKPYRGKPIRMKAMMRTEVTAGQGQLWLRIDCENKKMGFFDNMDNRPVKSKEWKEYVIKGRVDDTANEVVFGAFLSGDGKIWIDKFSIEIEENNKWIPLPIKNSSFEDDNLDAKDWHGNSPGYKNSIISTNAPDGSNTLMIKDVFTTQLVTDIFKNKANFGDFFRKDLGNGLICSVPLVLMGTENSTYPVADASRLAALKKQLEEIDLSNSYPYMPLSGAVVTWNVFQHFFPYKEEMKTDWGAELANAISEAYEVKNRAAYGKMLRILTEKLDDGHVSVSLGEQNYYSVQADVKFLEGKIIVSKVDALKGNILPLKVGDEIVSVDGVAAIQKFNSLKDEISGSNQWKTKIAESSILFGARDTQLELKIKRLNQPKSEMTLLRSNYRQQKEEPKIKELKNGIYYINIGNTDMKEIDSIMPKLTSAKGIICDLRGYPKQNQEFIKHLLTVKDKNKWMFIPEIIRPNYQNVTYQAEGWEMNPKTPHISAKIIFLTGGYAISYAESYMGFIKQYKLATIVGQPTAGANGNVNVFTVPGNCTIRFTGMKVKQQDGKRLYAVGIQPDVYVKETIKGVTEGRDEYLEKALELIN